MRGNTWQTAAIVAIILVVMLLIPLVIMGRGWQNLSEQAKQAKKDQADIAQKAAGLERETGVLKRDLIGAPEAATLAEVQKLHADIMEKAQPGENNATRTYNDVITSLLGDLEKVREELRKTSEEKTQLASDYNNVQKSYETSIAQVRGALEKVQDDRKTEQDRFIREREDFKRELNGTRQEQDATLARLERVKHELTDRANQLEFSNRDIRERNTSLTELLEDVRYPNVEHPAGKIISVNQQAGLAVVNLGSADGLLVRTMFSVYHSSITGITFRTAPVGSDAVYCDVCKREVSRNVSKASVEVTRILGPHRAEVRILDDILTDPIMQGDVVYSPIWKPGQKLHFALTAGLYLPNYGTDSGVDAIRHLIESNGGVVDCWIDENVAPGEDCLKGSKEGLENFNKGLTNFIVVGDGKTVRELEPEIVRTQEGLLENARNRQVKSISLGDLLSRMAWKNVTPVHTFDSGEYVPEFMRVVSQPQSTVRASDNSVAPIFTPDNPGARLNASDAALVRDSGGVVSPIYNKQAPPAPSSSGKTSNLFRPRNPQTE